MILRDITLCTDPIPADPAFNGQTNCITAHYLSRLGRFDNHQMRKLLIHAGGVERPLMQMAPNIWTVTKAFDFKAYWRSGPGERKRIVLDCVHSAAIDVATRFDWDVKRFETARQSVLDDALTFRFRLGKPRSRGDRVHKAQVNCEFDLEEIRVYLEVLEKDHVISSTLATRTKPHEVFLADVVGEIQWIADGTAALSNPQGTVLATVRIPG